MVQLFKLLHGLSHVEDLPILILSEPGLGKSSTVYQVAEVLQKHLEMKAGNKMDPTDLNALPYTVDVTVNGDTNAANKTNREVRYAAPSFVRTLNENPGSILFFDEITTCPASIQAAMLSIIQDCQAGEYTIPHSTIRIAAGNYGNIVGTHQMSLALMNRFCIIHYDFDVDYFRKGIVSGFQNQEYAIITAGEERVKKELNYRIAIADFLGKNPIYGEKVPEDIINKTDVSFPTPRAWTNLAKALAVLDKNDDEYIKIIIDGLIGPEAGHLFRTYLKETKRFEFDISKYFNDVKSFKLPNPDAHDEAFQIISSFMFYFKDRTQELIPLFKQILKVYHDNGYDNFIAEYLMSAIRTLSRKSLLTSELAIELSKEVPDWNELASLSTLSKNK